MSAPPPAGLPPGHRLEPATVDQVADVYALVREEQTAAFGFTTDSEEDVRALLDQPPEVQDLQLVVRDPDGEVVQWWVALRDPGDPVTHTWISTRPDLDDATSDELARRGWAQLFAWARARPPEAEGDLEIHSGCPAGTTANPRHLAEAGFTRQRTFWEMIGPVTDAHRTAPGVPGLEIEAAADVASVHAVLNEGFVGHYGFTPVSLEDFQVVEGSLSGFDPALRYLATVDGTPAAAMRLSRRLEAEGTMYVDDLATLAPFRRRGIASALLAHAFDIAAHEGMSRLSLHVDSENEHAAPAVYRRAGLEVRTAFWAYARTLTR